MKRKILFSLLLACFYSTITLGGIDSTIYYLNPQDTIFITTGAYNEKVIEHRVLPGQTLFSIARFYGLKVPELYYYNSAMEGNNLHPDQVIRVPVPNKSILRYKTFDFIPGDYAPVYYVVKKGDTMYRISKHFFRMPIEEIQIRNNLVGSSLKVGQKLHIGWMSIYGIPEEYRLIAGGPLVQRNNELKKKYLGQSQGKRERYQQGVAFWIKDQEEDGDFFCLHPTAPINSFVEVHNPMRNRKAYTKVIGRIPYNTYGDEVIVVVSPLTAKFLGVKDARFFVKLKYFK